MRLALSQRRERRGFTLVELLVVLAILVILLAMVAPTIINQAKKAKVQSAGAQISMFDKALKNYLFDVNGYPTTAQGGLQALLTQPQPDPNAAMGGAMGADPMMGGSMMPGGDPMMGGMPGGAPMMGGMPGGDPMMGGMPGAPGAVPTMDPMAGGMPGAVPTMPGMDPMMGGATTATAATGAWAGPYIDTDEMPKDPWGNIYGYEFPPTQRQDGKPEIWSFGPDGASGTADDIKNWDETDMTAAPGAMGTDPMGMPTDPMGGMPGMPTPGGPMPPPAMPPMGP